MNAFFVTFVDDETQKQETGVIIDTSYCPVRDRWMMLVSSNNGKMYNVSSTGLGVSCEWITEVVAYDEDEGDTDA